MQTIEIRRYKDNGKQSNGILLLMDQNCEIQFTCLTLELPWKENKRKESCINPGTYIAKKHNSPKFGTCLWLQDVKNRSEILVHPAIYFHQLLGCIAVGKTRQNIDGDDQIDISHSKDTMSQLLSLIKTDEVIININEGL